MGAVTAAAPVAMARQARRSTGAQQFVRVEHVHVNDGGQAFIGNVRNEEARA
jgi:hypothetical protein